MSRLHRLREKMDGQSPPALFISGIENLRYVSGFTGSTGFGLVTGDSALFFADPRYHIQAKAECPEFEMVACQQRLLQEAAGAIGKLGLPSMGVEKDHLTLSQHMILRDALPDLELTPTDNVVEDLRTIKEPGEIEAIRRACVLVDRACEHALAHIKEGISERDLAIEIDFFLRRNGAAKTGFDTIVAFGPHSAIPHAHPEENRLAPGQFVKMDFGAFLDGYNSDITRTVVFGPASERHREIHGIVKEAQQRALDAIRPGLVGKDVDAVARDIITEAGYGDQFGHGLGHGLGREVHECGALNRVSEIVLASGQVWTVEPGIYVEGFGGVRIEDDVVVTDSGRDVLTAAPKDFIVIR